MADEKDAKPQQGGWKTSAKNFGHFVWNSETHEFLGRGAKSWAQILAYYLVFYACLAGFFAINLSLFFTTIDKQQPRLQGFNTLLKGHPGMGFRPLLDSGTYVYTNVSDKTSWPDDVSNINDFLGAYLNASTGNGYKTCSNSSTAETGQPCYFDLDLLGPCNPNANPNMGYDVGQPCILLKLNKIYGWVPEPLQPDEGSSCNSDYNTSTSGGCLPPAGSNIAITCQGEVAADVDNMGTVKLYPEGGMSYYFYPYLNQPGYLQPLVMAQFENPTPGALLMIWCKAWAQNIYHDRNDLAGSVHFELMVDRYLQA